MLTPANLNALHDMIRKSSQEALNSLSGFSDVQIHDRDSGQVVTGHWMTLILLSGSLLRITLKTQYMTDSARHFASKIHGDENTIDTAKVGDFFKEFCNIAGGRIRAILGQNNVEVFVSLPIQLRGYDEFFFPRHKNAYFGQWQLRHEGANVDCSSQIETFGPVKVPDLEMKAIVSGEVEVL